MKLNTALAKYAHVTFLDLEEAALSKLVNHLIRTDNGNLKPTLGPIALEHGMFDVLEAFDQMVMENKHLMNSVLRKLEMDNRNKFGPRSIAKPYAERDESVNASFLPKAPMKTNLVIPECLVGNRDLVPLSVAEATKLLKPSTNSGLPFITKKSEIRENVMLNLNKLLLREDPCVLFTRTSELGKTRNVWGYPVADTLQEMRFYSPFLVKQKQKPWRAAIVSPELVGKRISEMLVYVRNNPDYTLYSIDFEGYDASCNQDLISHSFGVVMGNYDLSFGEELIRIATRFMSIGLITPFEVKSGLHGIPSGSTFTNEIGSLVQAFIAFNQPYVNERLVQFQGDDGAYCIPKDKVNDLGSAFTDNGLKVNIEKSYVDPDYIIYLQNLYHKDYLDANDFTGGIYPIYRALNRILFPEKWTSFDSDDLSGSDYYSIRTISILENCRFHPLFHKLVEFIYARDKHQLRFSSKGLSGYIKLRAASGISAEVLMHHYGDNLTGIHNFETCKYIRKLRGDVEVSQVIVPNMPTGFLD